MALVLRVCHICVIGCAICCFLVVALNGNYQKQQHGEDHQQQLGEQSQQLDGRDGQQPMDISVNSHSPSYPSVSHITSSSSSVSATETKGVEKPDALSADSVQQPVPEMTGVNRGETDYFGDNRVAEEKSKLQPARERGNESPSISPENVKDGNELKHGESHQRKTLKESSNVDSLSDNGVGVIFPSKEEYRHRYYGINRKGTQNIKKEKKIRKEKKKREDVVLPLASSNPMTEPASLSNEARDESVNEKDVNVIDNGITENKRQTNLYVFDKQHVDDGIDDYTEDDEDNNMNYVENISKYTGGRVKRRVLRTRDDWAHEDDRNADYAGSDYRERNKERHRGGRGRNRPGKGRGSNSNGHDRSSLEMDPDFDPPNYDPDDADYHTPRSPRRSRQRATSKGGGGGGGGDDGSRVDGGGGRGRRAGRDRHYGNRHSDFDSSERGYSDLEGGYSDERPHSASSPPSLSPSRHSDSYPARYSDDTDGPRISKSPSQKTCHICTMKKMDREVRLQTLKAQIMKQIGLNELPNITKNDRILSKVPALKHIIENMTMQRDEPSWRDSQNDKSDDITEQMIMTAEKPNHLIGHFGYNLSGLCYFNVSGKLETSIIKEATLWLYLRPQSKIRRSTVEVRIWDAVDRVVHSEPLKILKVEIGRFGEWAHVKATSIIKQWVKNTRLNYGLNITAFDSYGNNRIWTPYIPNHDEDYPVMDIKFSPRRHSRHRRTVGQMCTDEEHTGRCCLYPLMVDFLEMKWYWVIYPHHFEANYCSGNCSLEIVDDTSPYAYIGFKSATTIDGVRCCTSTREGELQILYYTDSNKIIHTYLEDIVVKECGCR